MHIYLNKELEEKLDNFRKKRGKKKSAIVALALEKLFVTEYDDAIKHDAMEQALDRYFAVPKNIPNRAFYIVLYLLSNGYPDDSSKQFWTEMVYRSTIDKTHKEILLEIQDDISRTIKRSKSVDNT